VQTPYRLPIDSLELLEEQFSAWARMHCEHKGGGWLVCRSCGATIERIRARLSLHVLGVDGCKDSGNTGTIEILYCPSCEDEPEELGCVHLPPESLFSVRIVGVVSDFGGCIPKGY
jgi:hypothetical protein